MTVVLCGVGGDTGNVRPVPAVDEAGRVEYVPIPEKGPTAETATYGSLPRRHGDGVIANLLDAVRPGSEDAWLTGPAVADQPVHRDPNFAAPTYGEHRPGYVARLRELEPGDVVGFYGGFSGPDTGYKHRYLFGYLTVAAEPTVLPPDLPRSEVREKLADHPDNAHTKRFRANGDLYYHDPAFTDRPETVVVVEGREGSLLNRGVRLSDRRAGPNYYMAEALVEALSPVDRTETGVHLGGFKPAVRCEAARAEFFSLVDRRG